MKEQWIKSAETALTLFQLADWLDDESDGVSAASQAAQKMRDMATNLALAVADDLD